MAKKDKKAPWRLLIPFGIGMGFGMVGVAVILAVPGLRMWADATLSGIGVGAAMLWVVGLMGLFLLSVVVQLVIHEAGHLAFGLLSGYRFVSYRIGSFMLVREDEKFSLRRFDIVGTGGQCLLKPPCEIDKPFPYRLYLAGGVLMNLLTAVAALLLLLYVDMSAICQAALFLFFIVGLLLAVTNGIPMTGVPNDGRTFLILSKDPLALRSLWLQLEVNALQTEGVRLKAMPDVWFELPTDVDLGNFMFANVKLMQIGRWLDVQQFDKAREGLSELEVVGNKLVRILRLEVACERAFVEMMSDGERSRIEVYFTEEVRKYAETYSRYMLSRIRLLYAYALLVEEDEAKAAELHARAVRMLPRYPIKGDAVSEIELMTKVESLAQERRNKKIDHGTN